MLVNSTTARFRVMSSLACFVVLGLVLGLALAGCGLAARAGEDGMAGTLAQDLTTDLAVHTNTSPATPWQDWSWWATVMLANGDAPLASGSTSQIKATVQTGGGAFSLAHSTGDLRAADYDAISFDVRAPSPSSLRIALETLGARAAGSRRASR
jgi:hypothetical protein